MWKNSDPELSRLYRQLCEFEPKRQNNRNKRALLKFCRDNNISYTNESQTTLLHIGPFIITFHYGSLNVRVPCDRVPKLWNAIIHFEDPRQVMEKLEKLHREIYLKPLWKGLYEERQRKNKKKCLYPNTMPLSSMRRIKPVTTII